MADYDKIIVGAGTAGCVMASRLSEDPLLKVLLLEAGPVFAPNAYPPELTNADQVTRRSQFTWGYQSEPGRSVPVFDVPAAKVAGGGSAINAGIIRRARPDDLRRWADQGVSGWSYDEVLSTYIAIENTCSGDGAQHGHHGPLPVRQLTPDEATPTLRAFVAAGVANGFTERKDFNADNQNGIALEARNVVDGVRVNTALSYLREEVRRRPNLTISEKVQVARVQFDGDRAIGVRLVDGTTLAGGEIILCAGVYGSPAILMRSGIGPAAHLTTLGIDVVADLPVGEGLRDHPMFTNTYRLRPDVRDMHPARGATLAVRSTDGKEGELDLWVFATNLFEPESGKTSPTLSIGTAVMTPLSRGTVRLRSRDPHAPPRIYPNLLAEPSDRRRLLEACRLSRRLARTAPLADLIDHEIDPGEEITDDEALLRAMEKKLTTFYHGCCTARMGADGDPQAVTDCTGRVRHVTGLRVADASIFPDIVSVPINLTTIMVAERLAAAVRDAAKCR